MIAKSAKLAQMIEAMKAAERAAATSVAVFCLSKDNIASVGTSSYPKIMGMGGPIFQVLRALTDAGGVSGDWTLCEAPISQAGKMAILLFRGSEKDVCEEIHKLVQVAQVQAS